MTTGVTARTILGGRYEVRAVLGKRGPCTTYLALDKQTLTTVALKELALDDRTGPARVLLGSALGKLSRVEHPRIPRFLDVVEYDHDGPKVALIQGYVKGKTIAQHVAEGRRFDSSEALAIARVAADALAYLHSRHPPVLHGSISPSHVLLDAYDTPHLIDFGVVESVLEDAGVPTGEGGGPPKGYVPFEQFAGRLVPASDVYSLGMTLIFAMTGRDPLQDAAAWSPAKIDPIWPEPLRKLLAGMTAPSWENRWRTGAALVKALPRDEASPGFPWARVVGIFGALAYWAAIGFHIYRGTRVAEAPLPPIAARIEVPRMPATVPLFRGDPADAAKRFLGAEHESGDVAWEQVHGRTLLFLRGHSPGYWPAFRAADGTLAFVEGGYAFIGRPENWRRKIPAPECLCRRVALDEYENVWVDTTCGRWRYDNTWHRTTEMGPLEVGPLKDPAGLSWTHLEQGRFAVGEGVDARTVRLPRAPAFIGHDHEGHVWTIDNWGRVTVFDRQRLISQAGR